MTKKVSKIFLYTVLSFVFLIVGVALFTQTSIFRSTLRSSLYTFLKDEINADMYIGTINGNLITGFSIDTVMIYIDGAPFVEAGKLSVHYNLFAIFNNTVAIDSLTLENPTVNLIRWKNGEWNIDHLSTSTSPDDSIDSPLVITAGKLRIINAQFHLTDSTGEYGKSAVDSYGKPVINYSNVDLKKLNIELSGLYSAKKIDVTINHVSFTSPREKFILSKLSAIISRTEQQTSVKKLVIVTPSSRIETSVELKEIDAFSIDGMAGLRRAQISLTASSSNINSGDIQMFFPTVDFMRGNVYFDGEFEGNFENLSVKKLNAAFGKTSISLSGTVSNMYKPEELRLNIVSSKSTINPSDVPALMPYFGIPDYNNLGIVTLDFQFVGTPNDFLAISKIKSAAGTVTVDGQVVITEENIHYKGIIAGNDVNLEKVFASNDFVSRLNTRIFIEGEGTTISTLKSEATIEIDSSMFRNIPLEATKIQLRANDKKIEGDISIHSSDGNINAHGLLDFKDEQMPSYLFSANVRGLDLAPVLNDNYYSSSLSFDVERSGKGLTLFDNPSETKIDFHNSNFKGMSFDSAHVVMTWLKDSVNNDRVTVRSPVVDATLEGKFTFNSMVQAIQTQLTGLDRIYTYQRSIVDSLFVTGKEPVEERIDEKIDSSSIAYDLTMKNLKPLSTFFDFPMLEMVGNAHGTISSDSSSASSSGTIMIAQGLYADTTSPIHLKNLNLNYSLNNISPKRLITTEDPLETKLTLLSDEINISGTALRLSKLTFDFNRQKGSYNFATDVDTMFSVAMEGKIEVSEYLNRFTVANLNAKYQGFELRNATPFVATETRIGFRIDSSVFLRGEEEFIVKGMYDYRGAVNANAVIKNFELSDIFFVSISPEFREQVFAMGGKVNATAQISGTVKNPVIVSQLEGKNISYRNSNIGDLNAQFNYSQKKAAIKVQVNDTYDSTRQNNFNLEGIVPVDLSFASVDDRTNMQGMDIKLIAANLPVDIFDVFIPEIDQLKGRATGTIHATGSLNNPLMIGSLQLDSGIFRLEMTGIQYEMAGRVVLDTQKITFHQFSISNLDRDYSDGKVNVAGYISLNGYAPSEYHLNANGELLVLQDRSRTANQSFFGTLITRTGANGLRFEGTFERSRIIGEILVQDAYLTFPPTQQTGSFSSTRFDDVIYIDDTSKQIIDTSLVNAFFQTTGLATGGKDKKRTFLDGFGYDLIIETQGNVRVNMIFNAEVGAYEELYAELNGKMTLKKDEESQQLIGSINVGEGSTYEFYKKFKASGSLKFAGDPQNPQLNIIAKYEGTRCINPKLKNECPNEERVIVVLKITGTRLDPKLKIGLSTFDQSDREIVRQGDVENDAIAFLLTSSAGSPGRFRDDLTGEDRNRLGDQLTEAIGGTFINSMLSEFVMEFIKKNNIPFVKRIEVRGVIQNPTETDINITGELSTAVINVGGRVFTDINNANISVQIPVLGKQNRNFMFEVEKKTESYETSIQARTILGARLFYRFTF